MQVVMDARTVSIVKELTTEQRQGINGNFESKEVLFRIAVDRDYKITKYENGQPVQTTPTDFFLAKATGNTAQVFADHCCFKKENGKLQSRHLLLTGHFETYQKDRVVTETVPVNFGGQVYNVEVSLSVPDTNYIFIVDKLKFLDNKPQNAQTNGTQAISVGTPVLAGTVPQNASVATPVAGQAPIAGVAPVMQNPIMPAVQPNPVAPATAVQSAVSEVVQDMNNAMNPPTIDANFTPVGNTAPF